MRMREVWILGLLVILLQFVDGLATGFAVTRFGTSMENNPLARQLMDGLGITTTVIVVKSIAVIGVFAMIWAAWKREQSRQMVFRLLWLALGAYGVMAYQWASTLQTLLNTFRIA